LITLLYYTNYQLPAISYLYAHVQQMEYNVEDQIRSTIAHNAESSRVQGISLPKLAVYNHGNYLNDAREAAFRTGKVGLFYELIGTLLVTSAISHIINHLYLHAISCNFFLAILFYPIDYHNMPKIRKCHGYYIGRCGNDEKIKRPVGK
jgi:hypothetical protein